MTHREEWEEKSFQVFTDEGGVLRSGWYPTGEGIVTGNVQVDRVWGNIPMQPNDDREDDSIQFGAGPGDIGWEYTTLYLSDTLRTSNYINNNSVQDLFSIVPSIATDHVNASNGYSNFPGYIPNYEGDEDSGLETVVPNLVRMQRQEADDLLTAANLDWNGYSHDLEANYVESTGTTVRVFAYNEGWNSWGGYESAALNGLRVGDQLNANLDLDGDSFNLDNVTVTAINLDGEDSWFEYKTATAISPALDIEATGSIYAGDNLVDIVTMQRSNHAAGSIKDEGFVVHYRYFGD